MGSTQRNYLTLADGARSLTPTGPNTPLTKTDVGTLQARVLATSDIGFKLAAGAVASAKKAAGRGAEEAKKLGAPDMSPEAVAQRERDAQGVAAGVKQNVSGKRKTVLGGETDAGYTPGMGETLLGK